MPTSQRIDTGRVSNRRTLRFSTLDEVLADAEQLAAAERAGTLRCVGNWTFGQNLGHLAAWVNYSFDGVPMKVPWFVKLMMCPMKKWMLNKPMRAGSNIPRIPGGTLGNEPLSTDEGASRIKQAFARLKAGSPAIPHLLFGPMNHEEWIKMHLRHAELHLSFCQAD